LSQPLRAAVLIAAAALYGLPHPGSANTSAGAGYYRTFDSVGVDTLRARSGSASNSAGLALGAAIQGYLSSWGLPPLPGIFSITDSGLVFQSLNGISARAATLSLAYVDEQDGRAHYLFRIDTGVFETETPGPLLDVAAHPRWLDSLSPADARAKPVAINSSLRPLEAARRIARSSYADSLYRLFGQPRARLGLIGRRGRAAGRLGEYIVSRDSLALDPGHMTGEAQLRHALAHELGHRWQSRAKAQLAALWVGVPEIRDPRRYGYRDRSEHQAEAIAFAVNFLQATATGQRASESSLALLEHYELLVPGTRALASYLLLQPLYRNHPLRNLLTTPRITYALEK